MEHLLVNLPSSEIDAGSSLKKSHLQRLHSMYGMVWTDSSRSTQIFWNWLEMWITLRRGLLRAWIYKGGGFGDKVQWMFWEKSAFFSSFAADVPVVLLWACPAKPKPTRITAFLGLQKKSPGSEHKAWHTIYYDPYSWPQLPCASMKQKHCSTPAFCIPPTSIDLLRNELHPFGLQGGTMQMYSLTVGCLSISNKFWKKGGWHWNHSVTLQMCIA